jgi:hypothetical protein
MDLTDGTRTGMENIEETFNVSQIRSALASETLISPV